MYLAPERAEEKYVKKLLGGGATAVKRRCNGTLLVGNVGF